MNMWHQWNTTHNHRAKPPQLFNSNMGGGVWINFNLMQPQLDTIAQFVSSWQPEEPPVEEPCRGAPRLQYHRVYRVLSTHVGETRAVEIFLDAMRNNRQTVGFSYDDAGIGDLDHRLVRMYGVPLFERQDYADFFTEFYPGATFEFVD